MDIGQLWVTLGVDASGLNKGLVAMQAFQKASQTSVDKVAASLERTSNEFQRFGSAANRYLTLPLMVVSGVAAKLAMDLDFISMKIVNLANISQAQMDAWQSSILSLSTATTVSAKQIAETLYYVASAGIKSKEAMEIVTIAAKAQASGMGKIEDVGRMLTYALNAYGKENLTAAHAADALTVAVREGTAESGSLVAVIGDVIPVAAQMGVEFDQVVGSLAAMTRTGFNAHKAATALRQIMVALLKPTGDASKAMEEMGTSGAELRKIMKDQSLIEALVKIDNLSSKFGEEMVGRVFGNVRALTGDLSLVGKNLQENLEILRKTKTEIGTFEKLFIEAAKTSKFSWDDVKNQANQAMIAIGRAITPSLIEMFKWLSSVLKDLSQWFNTLSTSGKENLAMWGAFLIAIGPVAMAIAGLIKIWAGLRVVILATTGVLQLSYAAILANPFAAVGFAIAGLIVYLAHLYNVSNRVSAVQATMNEVNRQAADATVQERIHLESLIRVVNNEHATLEMKKSALEGINAILPDYLGTIDAESVKTGKATIAIGYYINALQLKAKAEAAYQMQVEIEKKRATDIMTGNDKELTFGQNTSAKGILGALGISPFGNYFDDLKTIEYYQITNANQNEITYNKQVAWLKKVQDEINLLLEKQKESTTLVNKTTDAVNASAKAAKDFWDKYAGEDTKGKMSMLMDLMETANGKELDSLAKRWVLLDNELKKRKEVTDMAIMGARNGPAQPMQMIKPLGSAGVTARNTSAEDWDTQIKNGNKMFETMKDVSKGLSLVAITQGYLGGSFDVNTAKADVYNEALNQYLRTIQAMSPASLMWAINNGAIISTMKNLGIVEATTTLEWYNKTMEDTSNLSIRHGKSVEEITRVLQIEREHLDRLRAARSLDNAEIDKTIQKINILNQQKVNKEIGKQWENVFSTLSSVVGSTTKYMGKAFQDVFNAISDGVSIIGGVISFIQAIIDLTDLLSVKKKIDTLVTGAGIPVVLGAAAAQTTLAIASGNAAVAGAAASTSWIPIVGVGLAIAGMAAVVIAMSSQKSKASKMATGGIIPSGYPNDSYPAWLSSGEAVIPPGKLPSMQNNSSAFKTVKFRIEGRELVGVLEEMGKLQHSY